jgi:hypothetical protein
MTRHARGRAAVLQLFIRSPGGQRQFADSLHSRLTRYRNSTAYVTDTAGRARPTGDRFYYCELLAANAGRVPSAEAIRKILRG